jgi:hypothetical protein
MGMRTGVAIVGGGVIKDEFVGALLEPGTTSPETFVAFLKAEASRWSQLIRQVGIKAEQ